MFKRSSKKFSLTPKWPEHLPTHCGKCGNGYDERFSLEIGPGRLGRWLRKISPWLTIVMIALLFLTKLKFLELGGNSGAMAFAAIIVVPAVLVYILGGLLPTRSRLYCHKCNRSEFHPIPEEFDNRIARVAE